MWCAYGEVALIIHPTPLTSSSEDLGVFSTPVRYVDQAGFEQQWQQVAEAVTAHIACFHAVDEEVMMNLIDRMLFLGVIGTKHPGFAEEERVEDLFPA